MPKKDSRNDFSSTIKRLLAQRAGYTCSYPGCNKITSFPSSSDEYKAINNGVACHITAAAPNGPRFDSSLSEEERSSLFNGIWMCTEHSFLIDKDECSYSVSELREWKKNHEDEIKHLNLFAQCIALDELLEEKENIENFLSFIQMCMYSKQTLDEIENTEMKEYVVSIFKKAYSTTTKYRNPLELPGLWFKPKSYEDIFNSLISNIPKAADYR